MTLPRDLSGSGVVRILERLGFRVVRQPGSHIRLPDTKRHVTVPMHGSVAPGTLKHILRQAGVTLQDFLERVRQVFFATTGRAEISLPRRFAIAEIAILKPEINQ